MQQLVIDIMRESIMLLIEIAAPLLLVALIMGLIISIFQTATSIQEQTLSFVPKVLAFFITLMLCGSWITTKLLDFFLRIITGLNQFL
ncbi:flagellar biosynthetic protein FliQ [Candidatus Epulonipiscium fishelsonii]|uniref:Flagellar biosynthetic protein FliQ n=1 Tax=Candidatus Epulonipiscium fishelsonii TaxID=77094 RepID=A0ACC8XDI4_9FIRM|nr:flagellar biosynthetic protein FliQ [Epulopiscium sp. SCG-B05WGA-EpuloA1]ONI40996.1 flagellar biosynthetic protein FliQ [Epulopiscium sp. SCG-B11WGA-EpuloA1]